MKKEINFFHILTVLISVFILILSFFGCIATHTTSLISPEPRVTFESLISVSVAPTVIGVILLLFSKKRIAVICGSVVFFLQAIWVSVYPTASNMLHDWMPPGFNGVRSHCNFTGVGVVVCVLCWIAFLLSVVLSIWTKPLQEGTEKFGKKRYGLVVVLIAIIVIVLLLVIFKDAIADYIDGLFSTIAYEEDPAMMISTD